MKPLIAGTVLLTLVTTYPKTFADHHAGVSGQMPEGYARLMDKVIGDWKVESVTDGETVRAEFSVEWMAKNSFVRFTWKGVNPDTDKPDIASGLVGWSADKKQLIEYSIDNSGCRATAFHVVTDAGVWTSPMHGTTIVDENPVFFTWHRKIEVKSDDTWTVTTTKRMIDGKPQPDQVNTMHRKK